MRLTINFLVMLFIYIFNAGCKENPQDVQYGSIKGKVYNFITLEPLSGAKISTVPPTSDGISNDSGYFFLENINPGMYELKSFKYGFIPNNSYSYVQSGKTVMAYLPMSDSLSLNQTPGKPILLEPNDRIITSSTEIQLTWSCMDPDADLLYYDVYFDTSMYVSKVVFADLNLSKAKVRNLILGQTYYWKIEARDKWGASSVSDIYSIKIDSSYLPIDDMKTICYFQFDGNIDNKANVNLLMTKVGLTYVDDRHNHEKSAAYFNGSSSLSINNNPVLQLTDEFSILVWLKPDIGYGKPFEQTGYVYVAGMWYATGFYTSSWAILINAPSKQLECSTYDGITISNCVTDKLKESVWTHIAFIYKEGVTKIYINGELANSIVAVNPQQSPYSLEIGRHQKNICQYMGAMDDLIITKRALSDLEIKVIANK